ncbi:MAG: hypothetical protein NTW59_04455 [Candidatus Diapherotrites archaeon]|nr:hypothetical protein [Candidatus Diapherotrites archaeon]
MRLALPRTQALGDSGGVISILPKRIFSFFWATYTFLSLLKKEKGRAAWFQSTLSVIFNAARQDNYFLVFLASLSASRPIALTSPGIPS